MTLQHFFLASVFLLVPYHTLHAQLQPVELPQRHSRKIMQKMKRLPCFDPSSQYSITPIFYVEIYDSSKNIIPRDSLLWYIEYTRGRFFRHDKFVHFDAIISNERGEVIAGTAGSGVVCAYIRFYESVINYAKSNDIDFIFCVFDTWSDIFFLAKKNTVQVVILNDKSNLEFLSNPDFVLKKRRENIDILHYDLE